MTTLELLTTYYAGLAKKAGWESTISDGFTFTGAAGLPKPPSSRGKDQYLAVIERFSRVYEDVRLKESVVGDGNAFVVASYDLVSPSGKKMTLDIGEHWQLRGGKLDSLAIYYDTATFNAFVNG